MSVGGDVVLITMEEKRLEEMARLMDELLETVKILSDPEIMKAIREGLEDIRAGRVTELRRLLNEETH